MPRGLHGNVIKWSPVATFGNQFGNRSPRPVQVEPLSLPAWLLLVFAVSHSAAFVTKRP